jgi:hypothetical protein
MWVVPFPLLTSTHIKSVSGDAIDSVAPGAKKFAGRARGCREVIHSFWGDQKSYPRYPQKPTFIFCQRMDKRSCEDEGMGEGAAQIGARLGGAAGRGKWRGA